MDEIVIYQDHKKQMNRVLMVIALLIGCAVLIIAEYVTLGIIGVLFFGICFIDITYHMMKHKPFLIINDKGITFTTGFGEILWDEIENFEIDQMEKNKRINVYLKDFEKTAVHIKSSSLKIMKRRMKMGHEPVSILFVMTDVDNNEMYQILKTRLQTYKSQNSLT